MTNQTRRNLLRFFQGLANGGLILVMLASIPVIMEGDKIQIVFAIAVLVMSLIAVASVNVALSTIIRNGELKLELDELTIKFAVLAKDGLGAVMDRVEKLGKEGKEEKEK